MVDELADLVERQRIGLLPPAERVSGQRRYDESALRRLAVIDVAQRAGS